MKRFLLSAGLLIVFWVSAAQGAGWPKTEEALSRWDGPKHATLRTDAADPFASETVQSLLEMLLAEGYAVRMAPVDAEVGEGLVLDHRGAGPASVAVVALSAAEDGTVLSMERIAAPATGSKAPVVEGKSVPGPPQPRMVEPETAAPLRPGLAPFELPGRPRRIGVIGKDAGGQEPLVALLYGDRLEMVRVGTEGPKTVEVCPSPLDGGRALHMDVGDLDGDGEPEVAAVWAEDLRDIDKGTDSRIHTWVLDPDRDEGTCRESADLPGYIRMVGSAAYWQEKGAYQPFAGPVRHLVAGDEGYRPGGEVPWAGRDLYDAIPLSEERALAWSGPGKLQLVSRSTGRSLPGGTLLAELGPFAGPEVASRLETPEFRSGFAREDRVLETYHPLQRRISLAERGTAYTISRNRSKSLPFLGAPKGNDALVRIVVQGDRLTQERPFAEVPAFIRDFALVRSDAGAPDAVLLLNEKEDGSGQAYLLFQEGD